MLKVSFNAPDHQEKRLLKVMDLTGFTVSELMRRILDRFLQENYVNEICPLVSGQVKFKK